MKTFWNEHPNLTFSLLCFLTVFFASQVVCYVDNRQWGWALVALVALVSTLADARRWYDKT